MRRAWARVTGLQQQDGQQGGQQDGQQQDGRPRRRTVAGAPFFSGTNVANRYGGPPGASAHWSTPSIRSLCFACSNGVGY